VKSVVFAATVAAFAGSTRDGAAARSVKVRASDHGRRGCRRRSAGPARRSPPLGSEVVGAHAENFVVALRTLFAGEKSVSPFL
jgi:hypothetical protein